MGEVEINPMEGSLLIRSHIVTYGNEAEADVTERMRAEIENMWNEPAAVVYIDRKHYRVRFVTTAETKKKYIRAGDPAKHRPPQQLFPDREICTRKYFLC